MAAARPKAKEAMLAGRPDCLAAASLETPDAPRGRTRPNAGRMASAVMRARGRADWRSLARTAAGMAVLRDPTYELVESHPDMRGLLGDERGRGHARLGVDLQKDQIVVNGVITEVATCHPETP